jgi:hypothetical protein
MPTDSKIESYLADLDRALGPIALSERAEIVTEIKSHLQNARERAPDQGVDQLLASLGAPSVVANRYLLERGLKPVPAPKRRDGAKWLLGTVALLLLFSGGLVALLAWKFTPILAIDEKNDRITILGGFISIDGKAGKLKIGSNEVRTDDEQHRFEGSRTLAPGGEVRLMFAMGMISVANAPGNELVWKCMLGIPVRDPMLTAREGNLELDLRRSTGCRCELGVPSGARLSIVGADGKVTVEHPSFNLDLALDNGKVEISPDPTRKYRFDTHVRSGMVDAFPSSTDASALQMKVSMNNGKLSRGI